jgi:eukaryotic-like serine/threonine-protein kinase
MSLQIGHQLGSYEITSLLGKGGMGEVYRARDSKLKRDVAIKALPDEFSRDHDRLTRFQREAEVLASLNHSNIASIYDLQEANQSRFLIMELVEGETLGEGIARGPLPIDEALDIAKQICEALEAAHEKGIIHRDLKPGNVKILPDGKVKVLDFGLAKAFEGEAARGDLSMSPTLSMAATNAGVILGTALYMSPEQAKGKTLDKRTDMWSFGVVLYEMLTGQTAFSGESASEIMAAVIMRDPDWNALPRTSSGRLQDLLRRCLAKEPRNRLRDIGDARIAIEELRARPHDAEPVLVSRTRERVWIGLTCVLLIAVVALFIPTHIYLQNHPHCRLLDGGPASAVELYTVAITIRI